MDAPWHIEMLGGLRLLGHGRPILRFRTQKSAGLLAYLAYHLGRPIPREILIETFWPDIAPDAGRHNLRNALSVVRQQLELPEGSAGEALTADHTTVRLNPKIVTTDVLEFQESLRRARASPSETDRVMLLERAVRLYTGPLLPGRYEDWVLQAQAELAEAFFTAARQLIVLLDKRYDFERAVAVAKAAVGTDPLREDVRRDLMRLLARSGNPNEALRQYRDLERSMRRDLDLPPEDASRYLAEEIRRGSTYAPKGSLVQKHAAPPDRSDSPLQYTGTVTLLIVDSGPDPGVTVLPGALEHGGIVVRQSANGFTIAFESAIDAFHGAAAIHEQYLSRMPPMRLAIHTGDLEPAHDDSMADLVHRASLLLSATHPGQVLCSEEAAILLRHHMEKGWNLADLGLFRLETDSEPEHLWQLSHPGVEARRFPPPEALPVYAGYVPVMLTRFLGRENEMGQIADLFCLQRARLVTLYGPGGSGKTRLAIEAAGSLRSFFNERVWFVPLDDITSPAAIIGAVLNTFGLPRLPNVDPNSEAREFVARWPSLIVLDNFEHLVKGGAEIVQKGLEGIPNLHLLITSRRILSLPSEQAMFVSPLQIPPDDAHAATLDNLAQCESIALFLDRAQAVRLDFHLTPSNAGAVSKLCRRLEGLPLSIEHAAARVGTCAVGEILQSLSNTLDLSAGLHTHLPERHRSLRATLNWSYRLLSLDAQRMFAELSLFPGGFTPEAAVRVSTADRPREALEELRESSLVIAREAGDVMRFYMLATVREYAHEQMVVEAYRPALQRFVSFLLDSLDHGDEAPEGGISAWLDRVEAEERNVRLACEASIRDLADVESGVRMAELLWRFWQARGWRPEDCRWLAGLLDEVTSPRPDCEGLARDIAGQLLKAQGIYAGAWQRLQEAMRLYQCCGDLAAFGYTLEHLAEIAFMQGHLRESLRLRAQALRVFREGGFTWAHAMVLVSMANVLTLLGETKRARSLANQSLRMFRALESREAIATVLSSLANIAWFEGDLDVSMALEQDSLALRRPLNMRWGIGHSLFALARIDAERGECQKAAQGFAEALRIFRFLGDLRADATVLHHMAILEIREGHAAASLTLVLEALQSRQHVDDQWGIVETCHLLGVVMEALGEARQSARLLGYARVRQEAQGYAMPAPCRSLIERAITEDRRVLGEGGFRAAWAEGFQATLDELILPIASRAHPGTCYVEQPGRTLTPAAESAF